MSNLQKLRENCGCILSGGNQLELMPYVQVFPHCNFPYHTQWVIPIIDDLKRITVIYMVICWTHVPFCVLADSIPYQETQHNPSMINCPSSHDNNKKKPNVLWCDFSLITLFIPKYKKRRDMELQFVLVIVNIYAHQICSQLQHHVCLYVCALFYWYFPNYSLSSYAIIYYQHFHFHFCLVSKSAPHINKLKTSTRDGILNRKEKGRCYRHINRFNLKCKYMELGAT